MINTVVLSQVSHRDGGSRVNLLADDICLPAFLAGDGQPLASANKYCLLRTTSR